MNRDEVIRRGESAQHLLNNPTALAAVDDFQAECAEAILNSAPHQQELRNDAYNMARCLKLFKLKLQTWAADVQVEVANSDARRREAAEHIH